LAIPSIEGLRFNHAGTAIYFVDEDRSGSIYKYVPSVKGDYTRGQTFVLVVDDFDGDPSAKAGKFPDNMPEERTGLATWVAMTDENGVAGVKLQRGCLKDTLVAALKKQCGKPGGVDAHRYYANWYNLFSFQ